MNYNEGGALVICREFGCRDDANAWRKLTKEADKHKIFYCNLESKNIFNHLRHHLTNSRQSNSGGIGAMKKGASAVGALGPPNKEQNGANKEQNWVEKDQNGAFLGCCLP